MQLAFELCNGFGDHILCNSRIIIYVWFTWTSCDDGFVNLTALWTADPTASE